MKIIYFLSAFAILVSCSNKKQIAHTPLDKKETQEIVKTEFQKIIDSADVKGSILIYDLKADKFYSNDYTWAKKGNLPASTFKITNSIIAIETGVVEDDSTLFKWDGKKKRIKNWEQDLIFRDAFHFSCVPCYQEVARKIGAKNMNLFLKKLKYGDMKVDSSNIDYFWLEGESKISQFQQIDFLKRLYLSELPIANRTESIIKRMIIIKENDNYTISGKTGWSIRNGNNNGWFVGYIEKNEQVYFFATNVDPNQDFDMSMFSMIRKKITYNALEQMKIM